MAEFLKSLVQCFQLCIGVGIVDALTQAVWISRSTIFAVHSGDCGWVFSENVSEKISVISTGEFSIAFESFGTALYLLRVSDIGWVYHRGIIFRGLIGHSCKPKNLSLNSRYPSLCNLPEPLSPSHSTCSSSNRCARMP